MQLLVCEVVLSGGWCSFCFYLVGHSSCCSCNLQRNCCILLTLLVVGCFATRLLYCQTVPGGRVSCVLVTTSFEVVVPVGGSLDV